MMYQVSTSVLARGSVNVSTHWPPMSHPGADGRIYTIYGLLPSLMNLPGILIRRAMSAVFPHQDKLFWPLTSHLAPAAAGALLCVVFLGFVCRAGASLRMASLMTLGLAFGTALWLYSRYAYLDILLALSSLAFLQAALRFNAKPNTRRAVYLGVLAGLLINVKVLFGLSLVGAAAVFVYTHRHNLRVLLKPTILGLGAFLPFVAVFMAYNLARWGHPFETGYEEVLTRVFDENIAVGLWGYFFSPGKSLFLYNPALVLGFLGLPALFRRDRSWVVMVGLTMLPPLGAYSLMHIWPGGWCWGPRYLLYLVPVLLLPAVTFVSNPRHRALRVGLLVSLFVVGAGVQVLGNAFRFEHYLRISKEVRNRWLGNPNREGAFAPEMTPGHCDICYEDMYHHVWLPAFQPIAGHWWLLKHVPFGHSARVAQRDAPWRRYTSLDINVSATYRRAIVDWWGLLWLGPTRAASTPLGLSIFALMLAGGGGGAWVWWRALAREVKKEVSGRPPPD